jgi:hypothetical protein
MNINNWVSMDRYESKEEAQRVLDKVKAGRAKYKKQYERVDHRTVREILIK